MFVGLITLECRQLGGGLLLVDNVSSCNGSAVRKDYNFDPRWSLCRGRVSSGFKHPPWLAGDKAARR